MDYGGSSICGFGICVFDPPRVLNLWWEDPQRTSQMQKPEVLVKGTSRYSKARGSHMHIENRLGPWITVSLFFGIHRGSRNIYFVICTLKKIQIIT